MAGFGSLSELQEVDPRSTRFTPLGLGGPLPDEAAVKFHQESVERIGLVDRVPSATRAAFERVRSVHSYGVLNYEFFTVALDLAPFLLEIALRERFLDHFGCSFTFVKGGGERTVEVDSFDGLREMIGSSGEFRKGWRLKSPTLDEPFKFAGRLPELIAWARAEGLLFGQRNRVVESVLLETRHLIAHPSSTHLASPVDSLRLISDLAEITNRLWGSDSPGGRLFPGPTSREVIVVGWSSDHTHFKTLRADQVWSLEAAEGWLFVVLLGRRDDEQLRMFDDAYELTLFPTKCLHSPTPLAECATWLDAHPPDGDTVEYLDRQFLVRVCDGKVDYPRSPAITAGLLEASERRGTWYLLQADFPNDALARIRGAIASDESIGVDDRPRPDSTVAVRGIGDWEAMLGQLREIDPRRARGVRIPSLPGATRR